MYPKNKIFLSPVGGIVAAICFFLPWVKVDCFPQAATGADIGGILWIVFIAALVVIGSFFYYRQQNHIEQSKKIIMISSWSALALLLIRYISFAGSDYGKIGFTLQYGIFGVIIGFIASLVGVKYIEPEQIIKEAAEHNSNRNEYLTKPKEELLSTVQQQAYKKTEPQLKQREKPVAIQQIINAINSFDLEDKFKKHKQKLFIGGISFLILIILYSIFFVTSPVSDGKKAGETYNEYQNSLLQDQVNAYNAFLNNYDSFKFITKSQANEKLNELLNQTSAKTKELFAKQNNIYSKLRERYVDDTQKLTTFDNSYSTTLGSNNNNQLQNQQSSLYSQIQNKISAIISPEPDTVKIKNDLLGKSYTKGKVTWRFGFLSDILSTEIINIVRSNNYREYNISFNLYDTSSGDNFLAKMIVSYNYIGDDWVLGNTTMTNLEDLTKKKKY